MTECPRCGAPKHRRRCKTKNTQDFKLPLVTSNPKPSAVNSVLELHAGLGFRASIEGEDLRIEQDHPGTDGELYTHIVTLAPHEARELVDWIGTQVATQPAS